MKLLTIFCNPKPTPIPIPSAPPSTAKLFIRKPAISYREKPGSPQCVALLDVWETQDKTFYRFDKVFYQRQGEYFLVVANPGV
jgi:hypothetical protein